MVSTWDGFLAVRRTHEPAPKAIGINDPIPARGLAQIAMGEGSGAAACVKHKLRAGAHREGGRIIF